MPDVALPKRKTYSETIAADDRLPQFGFVGDEYERRRMLILGINPGNGPDAARSPSDSEMMPILHHFLANPSEGTFAAAMNAQMKAFPCWLASKEIGPILRDECVKEIEISYANASPYRADGGGARDAFPNKSRGRLAAANWVSPLLSALKPRLIIAHGQKAADVLENCDLQTKPLVYNRSRNQHIRSVANAKFVEQLRFALNNAAVS
jgi:hypothetical protein